MKPNQITNLRIHATEQGTPYVNFERNDRRYHVWFYGNPPTCDDTLHSNPIDRIEGARGHNQHRALDFNAKKYAELRSHIIAFVTPERIAEARQASAAEEEQKMRKVREDWAGKLRAVLHRLADERPIGGDDDLATALRELAEADTDDLCSIANEMRCA